MAQAAQLRDSCSDQLLCAGTAAAPYEYGYEQRLFQNAIVRVLVRHSTLEFSFYCFFVPYVSNLPDVTKYGTVLVQFALSEVGFNV